jgi:hypothetical protein
MALYSSRLAKATTATAVGVGSLEGSANTRGWLFYFSGGSTAAPADNNIEFQLQRSTTTPTGTSVTPNALDPADTAARCVVKENLTVQGTETAGAYLLALPCNQKATVQWWATPGCEIVVPASANTGFHVDTPVAGGTPAVACILHHRE